MPFQISPADARIPPPNTAPPVMLPVVFLRFSPLPTGWPVNSEIFSSAVFES